MVDEENLSLRLTGDIEFNISKAVERIREYCEIEVYYGYDDRHNINNNVEQRDIVAANELYAMIDRYDPLESRRILNSPEIPSLLAKIENLELADIPADSWQAMRDDVRGLIQAFLLIPGVRLAKAFKVLHLKRPRLFPILDSYVIRLLKGVQVEAMTYKPKLIDLGMQCLETVRQIIEQNRPFFDELKRRLDDVPIRLTTVRLFDILYWTTEKWDIRGITTAPRGVASRSLLKQRLQKVETSPQPAISTASRTGGAWWVNVDKPTKTCTLHTEGCTYEQKKTSTPYKGIGELRRDGGWLSFDSLEERENYVKQWAVRGYRAIRHCL